MTREKSTPIDLKACSLCGSPATARCEDLKIFVECTECDLSLRRNSWTEAVEAWNTRPRPASSSFRLLPIETPEDCPFRHGEVCDHPVNRTGACTRSASYPEQCPLIEAEDGTPIIREENLFHRWFYRLDLRRQHILLRGLAVLDAIGESALHQELLTIYTAPNVVDPEILITQLRPLQLRVVMDCCKILGEQGQSMKHWTHCYLKICETMNLTPESRSSFEERMAFNLKSGQTQESVLFEEKRK